MLNISSFDAWKEQELEKIEKDPTAYIKIKHKK